MSQFTSSLQCGCTCNHAKTTDELILEHHRSMQILLKNRKDEIEFLSNEVKKINQQNGKIKSVSIKISYVIRDINHVYSNLNSKGETCHSTEANDEYENVCFECYAKKSNNQAIIFLDFNLI